MKTIIAGSRVINQYEVLLTAINLCPWKNDITEIVSGHARGVDLLGEKYALENNIKISCYPANWIDKNKRMNYNAGFERNQKMADYADALIAIWDGYSSGTKHMIQTMKKLIKPVYILKV